MGLAGTGLFCCSLIVVDQFNSLIILFIIGGLVLVDFSLAPITPIAFFMAAKVSDRIRGREVSIVTISGYCSVL
ncbi:hypothetical protein [Gracilibacillus alcaliphilus]|uniref:hypothetical protein n=1 Tax=Gracilibacillus alcaliphilus TaxID=1401441 RepID=UPI00195BF0AE|nr:hypothetical protein [Gracilibacillus alcaliphilus]MBM7675904.1 hypothetical protein [Gracilibacillus alcaliphilus]